MAVEEGELIVVDDSFSDKGESQQHGSAEVDPGAIPCLYSEVMELASFHSIYRLVSMVFKIGSARYLGSLQKPHTANATRYTPHATRHGLFGLQSSSRRLLLDELAPL